MGRTRRYAAPLPCLPPRAALLLAALLLPLPSPALGEMYVDLFAGQSRASSDNVTVTNHGFDFLTPSTDCTASREESFHPGLVLGGRVRTWFPKALWLGMAGEFSYFRTAGERTTVDAFPLSLQLLFRAPLLPHPDYPVGRLHPYAGAGLSWVFYRTRADLRPCVWRDVSTSSTSLGFLGLAGVAFGLTPHTFLFAEGRYTAFDASVDTGNNSWITVTDDEAKVDVAATQFLLGASLRLGEDPPRRGAAAPPAHPSPPAPVPAPLSPSGPAGAEGAGAKEASP